MLLAALLACPVCIPAQEPADDERFSSLATYAMSFPAGYTRRYVSMPSFVGAGWEGMWSFRGNTAVGFGFSMHDFFRESRMTMDFPWGAATGDQARDLLVASLAAQGRWYTGDVGHRRAFFGLGAGGLFVHQSYQLAFNPLIRESALHPAIAPEAGFAVPVTHGVDVVGILRYTISRPAGDYVGGGPRRFPFATFSIGFAER